MEKKIKWSVSQENNKLKKAIVLKNRQKIIILALNRYGDKHFSHLKSRKKLGGKFHVTRWSLIKSWAEAQIV
jgi:hypothetical protein